MRTLYIECKMGAAGDMLMASLYELLEDKQGFLDTMNGLGLPGVRLEAQKSSSCGIAGTHMKVTVHGEEEHEPAEGHDHDHEHHHATPRHIADLINGLKLPEKVKGQARAVYRAIAESEARAHGCPV